jgi:hypothetical protein
MIESDLEIYDVWEAPNGNIFIKMSQNYSIGIGTKGNHAPLGDDLHISNYSKSNDITPVKRIGKLCFGEEEIEWERDLKIQTILK